jgi:hypothetical protein
MKPIIFTILLLFPTALIAAWYWATGINNMNDTWPDYKGEDMLDETPPQTSDKWDDNQQHTEQGL